MSEGETGTCSAKGSNVVNVAEVFETYDKVGLL